MVPPLGGFTWNVPMEVGGVEDQLPKSYIIHVHLAASVTFTKKSNYESIIEFD
jgi:hypothetical protein